MTISEYEEKMKIGKPAQARVHGVLRGGFLVGEKFYFFGIEQSCTDDYSELKVYEENRK